MNDTADRIERFLKLSIALSPDYMANGLLKEAGNEIVRLEKEIAALEEALNSAVRGDDDEEVIDLNVVK